MYLDAPDQNLVLPADELAEVGDPIRPHWDPALAKPGAERRKFVQRLAAVDLITYRTRRRCDIGAFFVRKKDTADKKGRIRLVLDCRPVNQLHRAPPKSRLATPGALSTLCFSEEWARLSAASEEDVELSIAGASIDLQDGFYQFAAESVSSWFCLGERFTAKEAGVSQVYNESTMEMEAVRPDQLLWACVRGLPMGWSWALYFCQSVVSSWVAGYIG